HGPYMPIYFITSAMMSGCALVIFFHWVAYRINGWKMSEKLEESLRAVAKLGALLYLIIMFFTTWKMISGFAGHPPGKYEAIMSLLNGPFSRNFWYGEVALGIVIPFLIILAVRARNLTAMAFGSMLSIIGIFVMRYDLVIVGQSIPGFNELGLVDLPHILPYAPTLHEWMVTLSGFTFCGVLFMMGERMFRGHLSEDH
ncbi:MAG: polysulfide reductase NrfD, partial [Desulfobulbaceae bacterium]|nr:polysulfide reductase NrfD [Desulfobulbaceae bacterium]